MLATDLTRRILQHDLTRRAGAEARSVYLLARAGALGLSGPSTTVAVASALRAYGPFAASTRLTALRHGDNVAITDERGQLTYAELDEQVNRVANALLELGLSAGDGVGILGRNHRAPLIIGIAAARAGVRSLWLNTGFSAPQLQEVCAREGISVLVHDEEFQHLCGAIEPAHGRFSVVLDGSRPDGLDELIRRGSPDLPPPPAKPGRIVLLTSGTTGTPKGAGRPDPSGFTMPGAVLDRMPMRSGTAVIIAPPIFHGTGLLIAMLGISLGCNLVLRPRFDAERLLADIETYRASTVCVVPVMMQRICDLGPEVTERYDLSSLTALFTAGSQVTEALARRVTGLLGPVMHNLYGSTEVSIISMATPLDVDEAPTSVGRPALGVRVAILDATGEEVPIGTTGRIFAGTFTSFEGYTGGADKERCGSLVSTGDLGHLDAAGRLYVDGRDDDMIVSGGENVFPAEVEELIAAQPAVREVAVVGVPDETFGQRLVAFVVPRRPGAVTAEEVQALVKTNLARYKVPREVRFIDELPRNPTGKVLKRELVTLVCG